MNYIELINNFWQKDIEYAFSDREIALYFYLLKTCNSIGWKNPFGLSNSMTAVKFHWGKQAFDTAKQNLQRAGLIDFSQGVGRGRVSRYEIKGTQTDTFYPSFSQSFSAPFSPHLSAQKAETSLNVNKTKLNNKEKQVVFTIPSVEEISQYCIEKSSSVDAREFFDYYQAKGWTLGKGKMRDWHAAIRIWERNIRKNTKDGQGIASNTKRDSEAANRKAEIINRAIRAVAECNNGG